MNVSSSIDSDRNLVLISLAGDTTVPEAVAAYDAVLSDPNFQPNMNAVWDLTHFDLKRKPINDVRELVRQLRGYHVKRGDDYKAALVTNRPVDFQLLRIYLTIIRLVGSQVTIKAFQKLDDAYDWLNS